MWNFGRGGLGQYEFVEDISVNFELHESEQSEVILEVLLYAGIVIRDPQTNKQLLFLGRRPHAYIVGMGINQSEDLLDDIWQHATQVKFTWTQKWKVGDLLMWKNLNVLHKRDAFDPSTRRVMHRTQLKGDIKIAI